MGGNAGAVGSGVTVGGPGVTVGGTGVRVSVAGGGGVWVAVCVAVACCGHCQSAAAGVPSATTTAVSVAHGSLEVSLAMGVAGARDGSGGNVGGVITVGRAVG
jgi:hypothetical protein